MPGFLIDVQPNSLKFGLNKYFLLLFDLKIKMPSQAKILLIIQESIKKLVL